MSEDKQELNEYERFLRNYGKEVPPQEAKQALFDSQIKNMSLSFSNIIKSSDNGTILDIGCGKGKFIVRFVFFKNKPW